MECSPFKQFLSAGPQTMADTHQKLKTAFEGWWCSFWLAALHHCYCRLAGTPFTALSIVFFKHTAGLKQTSFWGTLVFISTIPVCYPTASPFSRTHLKWSRLLKVNKSMFWSENKYRVLRHLHFAKLLKSGTQSGTSGTYSEIKVINAAHTHIIQPDRDDSMVKGHSFTPLL